MSFADMDMVKWITISVWEFYMPALIFVGTIGNCWSVCVCLRTRKMRNSSSSYYLAALAISDQGNLACCLAHFLFVSFDIQIYRGYVCQIMAYFSTFCNLLSAWFVVAFTYERFVAVRFPLRRSAVCTVTRAKRILIGLTALGFAVCTPLFYVLSPTCLIVEQWRYLIVVFGIFNTIVSSVLPFTAIAVLNALIVKSLRRHADVRRALMNNVTSHNDDSMAVRKNSSATVLHTKTTRMLLIVSSVFLCLNLPFESIRLYNLIKPEGLSEAGALIRLIGTILYVTSFGINFFLYCASGQDFRQAALDMIVSFSRSCQAAAASLFGRENHFDNAPKSNISAGSCSRPHDGNILDLSTNISSELQDLTSDATDR